jgi:hypothetical protein|tara:strand:- start:556 stop:723 length:168 start_codon:yes stop_codon:yes gene_type:complete
MLVPLNLTPWSKGNLEVKRLVTEGPVTEACEYVLSTRAPCNAKESIFGVTTFLCP